MNSKTFFDSFETIANAPGGIARLRELILDLAVGGRFLTEGGDSDCSPISVNHEVLKLDLEKLWTLPAALPEPAPGWSRVPLARLGQWGSGGTPTASRKEYYQNGTIPWAVIGDLNNSVMTRTESFITRKALEMSSTKMIPIGAVLVAMYGASIGKSAISGIECCTNQAIAHCVVDEDVISSKYMFLVIKSLKAHLIKMGKGAAQPNISQSVLKHLVIDIPPKKIQSEVINQINELFGLCDELEFAQTQRNSIRTAARRSAIDSISTATTPDELNAAWKRISDNWINIADTPESLSSLRALILGLAVRGKLVPQIANEKLLEAVTVNGKFELPNSWRWVKISTVTEFVNGFAFKSEEYSEDGIGIVRMSDLKLGQIAVQGMKRVPEKYRTILDENLRVSPGDLVIGMSGSIGKPCFNLTDKTFLLNQRVGKFVPHSVDKSYLAIVLQTLENSFLEMSAGSGIKNLSTKQIKDAELPLPPALEQKRIVSKVAQLMTLCDQLEHSLIKRDEIAKKIAGSLASEIAA